MGGRGVSGEDRGPITLAEGAAEVGLATMLADLIAANLEKDPRKWNDFRRLASRFIIDVVDAEVSITLAFSSGALTVHGGAHGEPDVRIATTAELLLALCMLRVVNGVPRPLHRDSRPVIASILRGAVKIGGLGRRPLQLLRFTRLVSVNG